MWSLRLESYAQGDRVIQLVNDYEKDGFNGDVGRIRAIDLKEWRLHIEFDGRPVT